MCFVGMDGSGKSTIINLYKKHLAESGHRVESYWWLEGEKNLFRDLGKAILKYRNKGEGGNSRFISKGIQGNRLTLLKKIYINAVVKESLIFGVRTLYLKSLFKKNRIVLLDRYYYDTIFALSKEFNLPENWMNRNIKLFQSLLPSPDIVIYINLPYEMAFIRKPEEFVSLEDAKEKSDEYKRFREMISKNYSGHFTEFDNSVSSFEPLEILFRELDEKCVLL